MNTVHEYRISAMLAVVYLMLDEKNKLESDKITNMIWVKHKP